MICLNFEIYQNLCRKYHLEQLSDDSIQWGLNVDDVTLVLTTFSPSYGVKINVPDENGRWYWGCWCISYAEVDERLQLLIKNIKLLKIKKKLVDIQQDFE